MPLTRRIRKVAPVDFSIRNEAALAESILQGALVHLPRSIALHGEFIIMPEMVITRYVTRTLVQRLCRPNQDIGLHPLQLPDTPPGWYAAWAYGSFEQWMVKDPPPVPSMLTLDALKSDAMFTK